MNARDSLLIALPAALLGVAVGFFLSQARGAGADQVQASRPVVATVSDARCARQTKPDPPSS